MDLMGWLGSAVQVRNDIKAQIAELERLDAKWRELEEALREQIRSPKSSRKLAPPSNHVGSLDDRQREPSGRNHTHGGDHGSFSDGDRHSLAVGLHSSPDLGLHDHLVLDADSE